MRRLSPKDASETCTVTFDFTADLGPNEILTGTPTVVVAQFLGPTDPNVLSMLNGLPVLSGNKVLQSVILGLNGNIYSLVAECSTSTGQKLMVGGLLPVLAAQLQ